MQYNLYKHQSERGIKVSLDGHGSDEFLGYPQFFTQLLFKKDSKDIFIKTVINNEEGITKISSCKNLERYKKKVIELAKY